MVTTLHGVRINKQTKLVRPPQVWSVVRHNSRYSFVLVPLQITSRNFTFRRSSRSRTHVVYALQQYYNVAHTDPSRPAPHWQGSCLGLELPTFNFNNRDAMWSSRLKLSRATPCPALCRQVRITPRTTIWCDQQSPTFFGEIWKQYSFELLPWKEGRAGAMSKNLEKTIEAIWTTASAGYWDSALHPYLNGSILCGLLQGQLALPSRQQNQQKHKWTSSWWKAGALVRKRSIHL